MLEFSSGSLTDEIKKDGITIVTFGAVWCRYCSMINEELLSLEKLNPDIKLIHVDCDEHEQLAIEYNVLVLPTSLYFVNGALVKVEHGYKKLNELKQIIESLKN